MRWVGTHYRTRTRILKHTLTLIYVHTHTHSHALTTQRVREGGERESEREKERNEVKRVITRRRKKVLNGAREVLTPFRETGKNNVSNQV